MTGQGEPVPVPCHCEPVTDVTGVAIRLPDPYTADTELLIGAPYGEELYTAYVFAQIDLNNAEIEKYNQSASLFSAAWRQLADRINRTQRPKGQRRWRF